jgi:mannose-1-phosphate guanylyltransferase
MPAQSTADRDALAQVWAVILAGGDGVRLRPLVRLIHGDDRPKQYAVLVGRRSLLRCTLDRVAATVTPGHTVVVSRWDHAEFLRTEFAGRRAPWVLLQPADRGTAAGIFLPACWVRRRSPGATIAVLPSDHFIADEPRFMAHLAEAAAFVRQHPTRLVLLGAPPTWPDTDLGFIEAGARLGGSETCPVYGVRGFWEKPAAGASPGRQIGLLWNTFVMVGRASTLIDLGRRCTPRLLDQLRWTMGFQGTADEAWAIDTAYSLMPSADFARAVLERCPPALAVSPLPPLLWFDLGTPERVRWCLEKVGTSPAWSAAS